MIAEPTHQFAECLAVATQPARYSFSAVAVGTVSRSPRAPSPAGRRGITATKQARNYSHPSIVEREDAYTLSAAETNVHRRGCPAKGARLRIEGGRAAYMTMTAAQLFLLACLRPLAALLDIVHAAVRLGRIRRGGGGGNDAPRCSERRWWRGMRFTGLAIVYCRRSYCCCGKGGGGQPIEDRMRPSARFHGPAEWPPRAAPPRSKSDRNFQLQASIDTPSAAAPQHHHQPISHLADGPICPEPRSRLIPSLLWVVSMWPSLPARRHPCPARHAGAAAAQRR